MQRFLNLEEVLHIATTVLCSARNALMQDLFSS